MEKRSLTITAKQIYIMYMDDMKLNDLIHVISALADKLHKDGQSNIAAKMLDIRQELLDSIIDDK